MKIFINKPRKIIKQIKEKDQELKMEIDPIKKTHTEGILSIKL